MAGPTFKTLQREEIFRHPPKDQSAYPVLAEAVAPHIESFNALTEGGLLDLAVKDVGTKTVIDPSGNKWEIKCEEVQIAKPMLSAKDRTSINRKIYPSEARERLSTYRARIVLKLSYRLNNGPWESVSREAGLLPIMVRSNRCHLTGMAPADLVSHKEESDEMGGYFIVNGNEKLIRLLIVTRRNHAMALVRPSFANRGNAYSHFGVQIRCVRPDQSSQGNTLHYLNDGNAMLRISWRKNEYLVPIMMVLKALVDTNDKEIFDGIVGAERDNTFLTDRVELLLRTYKAYSLYTQEDTLRYLGEKFRVVMNIGDELTDVQVGREWLRKIILVHLDDPRDKFRMLLFMIRKLYALVAGDCAGDNPDSPQHQEVLLGGFLYGMIIKEKIEDYLTGIRAQIMQDIRRTPGAVDLHDSKYLTKAMAKVNGDIGAKLTYFLSTGNLVSNTGLDLQQATGYTIVAEKLNFYRYISHFRMVHRGSFFAELKTTTVRKLLPEAWGFLCPVHTPDGTPCGLLNHMAHKCKITTAPLDVKAIPALLASLGVSPPSASVGGPLKACVQLDGRIVGWCTHALAKHVADTLRFWKVEGTHGVPLDLEIGLVPESTGGQYPGLYLFSQAARMVRPVKYLRTGGEDHVGPFEQVHMEHIACMPDEILPGLTTHIEYAPTNILSIVANLTPFSDFNQSPRNMYQCQMGKQAMGTPGTAIRHRTDNKLYRLQTGQTPIVRPALHDAYGMDANPNGMNAVVAVISYTGYDMEDAMILNKSAHERGFGYGTVYKSEKVDLSSKRRRGEPIMHHFGFGSDKYPKEWLEKLDGDGLPQVGVELQPGDPIAAWFDDATGKTSVEEYHGTERAFVDEVRVLGNDSGDQECQGIHVKLRVTRSPVTGDKFSSRHGQKGVLSQKWPAVDMPFSESGMQPDVIINPHAFPSRMTIGMFVESLAGKAGALHGMAQDATPFKFSEEHTAADFFGQQLLKAGYNYHGNEPFYSGITGEEMKADIYVGCVFYQRLRHMVNDKFQVRTTGAVHNLTHQPIGGRKRGGGVRFGEMERDAIIAHGTSFILQDRLMNCSDYSQAPICRDCGSLLTTMTVSNSMTGGMFGNKTRCRACAEKATGFEAEGEAWEDASGQKFVGGENVTTVAVPYVFRYLSAELTAMGIKMTCRVSP
ncbi:DNA-directed RNA polymerase I subunit rpa2 [Saitoella coloradoensis]